MYWKIVREFRSLSNCILEVEIISKGVFDHDPCSDLRNAATDLKKTMTSLTPRVPANEGQVGLAETTCSRFRIAVAEAQAKVIKY